MLRRIAGIDWTLIQNAYRKGHAAPSLLSLACSLPCSLLCSLPCSLLCSLPCTLLCSLPCTLLCSFPCFLPCSLLCSLPWSFPCFLPFSLTLCFLCLAFCLLFLALRPSSCSLSCSLSCFLFCSLVPVPRLACPRLRSARLNRIAGLRRDPLQELARALFLRIAEQLHRRSFLDDDAAVHEHDMVRHVLGETHLMRHDDHRDAFPGDAPDDRQHLPDELGIERRGRLVEQDDLRLQRQRPGDADPLLLASGQLARVGVQLLAEPDLLQQPDAALAGFRLRKLAGDQQPFHYVLQRGLMPEQVVLLEYHRCLPAQLVNILAADRSEVGREAGDMDAALARFLEIVQAAEQRRLARAARPQYRDHLALFHLQVDALQHLMPAERQLDSLQLDHATPPRLYRLIRRSTSADILSSTMVSPQKMAAAARKASKNFQFVEATISACALMSTTDTTNASVEACIMPMTKLDKFGTLAASACGNTIRRSACAVVMPTDSAASSWPRFTDRRPERITSEP
ncbi:hypothetical protein BN871_AI_01050 [Paenibacillus sp. P22]|nr:hypothetical protein BN871_AI_01050 [Paenibacillus sp. P22]